MPEKPLPQKVHQKEKDPMRRTLTADQFRYDDSVVKAQEHNKDVRFLEEGQGQLVSEVKMDREDVNFVLDAKKDEADLAEIGRTLREQILQNKKREVASLEGKIKATLVESLDLREEFRDAKKIRGVIENRVALRGKARMSKEEELAKKDSDLVIGNFKARASEFESWMESLQSKCPGSKVLRNPEVVDLASFFRRNAKALGK